jgi:hypothetical protein
LLSKLGERGEKGEKVTKKEKWTFSHLNRAIREMHGMHNIKYLLENGMPY